MRIELRDRIDVLLLLLRGQRAILSSHFKLGFKLRSLRIECGILQLLLLLALLLVNLRSLARKRFRHRLSEGGSNRPSNPPSRGCAFACVF